MFADALQGKIGYTHRSKLVPENRIVIYFQMTFVNVYYLSMIILTITSFRCARLAFSIGVD